MEKVNECNTCLSLGRQQRSDCCYPFSTKPTHNVKRWKKDLKEYENVSQPLLLKEYNKGMGGVDLHDNAV